MTNRYEIKKVLGELIIFDKQKENSIRLTDAQMSRFKKTIRRYKLIAGEDRPLEYMLEELCGRYMRENA